MPPAVLPEALDGKSDGETVGPVVGVAVIPHLMGVHIYFGNRFPNFLAGIRDEGAVKNIPSAVK